MNRTHLLVQWLGQVVLPAQAVELGQVVAGGGDVGVVRAKALARQLHRLLAGLQGARISLLQPTRLQRDTAQHAPPADSLPCVVVPLL